MKRLQQFGLALAPLAALVATADVRALPVPDSGNCTNSPSVCLRINNGSSATSFGIHSESGIGVAGIGSLTGVTGSSNTGIGVNGASRSSAGVRSTSNAYERGGVEGTNTVGNGVYGSSEGTGASGIYGFNGTGGGFGIAGRVPAAGSGVAVYGDAAFSSSAWAGRFDGRVTATAFVSSSDARLKTDVKQLSHGLDTVRASGR